MKYDVVGIGYPLLDKVTKVSEDFIIRNGLTKSKMHLVSSEQSRKILSMLDEKSVKNYPGGSAANTLASVCRLGGNPLFLGMTGNDFNGNTYRNLIEEIGIVSDLKSCNEMQGTCVVMVTPDAERTMATHHGAAMELSKEDIDLSDVSNSKIF